MEVTELPMSVCNLQLEIGDGVDFDFSDFSGESSSASVSGSSYAASSFGPRTPTSGRSTPHFSTPLDFGSSFASSVDPVPFDPTPPSSTTSAYFPSPSNTGNMLDFGFCGFPVTPSRGHINLSGHPFGSGDCQPLPPQSIECDFFGNQLGHYPLLSTPPVSASFDHLSQANSQWVQTESPIRFELQSPTRHTGTARPIVKQEQEDEMTTPLVPTSAARKRVGIEEARHRTMAFQEAQQLPPPGSRTRAKRERRARTSTTDDGTTVENVKPSKHRCPLKGCTHGPYQRPEHLKRHIDSKHKGKLYPCNWCPKVVNRPDNWLAHLKLHTQPRAKGARVDYFPGAVLEYERVVKQIGARRRRNPNFKQKADPDA